MAQFAINMFPARAGMNRSAVCYSQHMPMFPARAGMNRDKRSWQTRTYVPRTCGDEPQSQISGSFLVAHVPRTCGDETG